MLSWLTIWEFAHLESNAESSACNTEKGSLDAGVRLGNMIPMLSTTAFKKVS